MGTRINLDTFDDLTTSARLQMLDGLTRGEGFGKIVGGILMTASAFGGDEAERADRWPASVSFTDFDEMKREFTGMAIDGMFKGVCLDSTVRAIVLAGAAFGFQNVKKLKAA